MSELEAQQRNSSFVLNQASITGMVFVDTNQNGLDEANEMGIDRVTVELLDGTGIVVETAVTSDGGFYLFEDHDPGTYQVRQVQPSGMADGAESLGGLGGEVLANDLMQVALARTDGADYDFAEIGQAVSSGDTAGIGFWQNKHGQARISQGGTALATWLTDNFGNVFGDEFVGKDGVEVAKFYKEQLFKQKAKKSAGPAKVDAQFMAVALATFFTSENLAGTVAADYGFNVTDTGMGTKIVNVGSSGAAFGGGRPYRPDDPAIALRDQPPDRAAGRSERVRIDLRPQRRRHHRLRRGLPADPGPRRLQRPQRAGRHLRQHPSRRQFHRSNLWCSTQSGPEPQVAVHSVHHIHAVASIDRLPLKPVVELTTPGGLKRTALLHEVEPSDAS